MTKSAAKVVAEIDLAPIRNLVKKYHDSEAALAKTEDTEVRLNQEIDNSLAGVDPTDQASFNRIQDQLRGKRDQLALLPMFRSRCEQEIKRLDEQINAMTEPLLDYIARLSQLESEAFRTYATSLVLPFMHTPQRAAQLIEQMDVFYQCASASARINIFPPFVKKAESALAIIDGYFKTGTLCAKPWMPKAADGAPDSK